MTHLELANIRQEYNHIRNHHVRYTDLIDTGKIIEANEYYGKHISRRWSAHNFSGKFSKIHPFDDMVIVDGVVKAMPSKHWGDMSPNPPTDLYILCDQVSNEIRNRLAV